MLGGTGRILTIQSRMREIGRIRLGIKDEKKNPKKLTTFRFTSRDKRPIEKAAELYGGKVMECDGAKSPDLKGQWEVVTDVSEIPFYPSPVPVSQYMELWSGGGCQRRCDGCTESISGEPCLCDPESLECKPTTRLSVILPDLPDIGVWRLESHGWNAAAELVNTYDWLRMYLRSGKQVEALLAVEERTGKKDGKTTRFMVPVIRIPDTPRQLVMLSQEGVLPPSLEGAPALGSARDPAIPVNGSGKELPVPAKHETPEHVLKEPNPRGGVFALLHEMGMPQHDGKAKGLYYEVFSARLQKDVTSLSALSDDDWRSVWTWLLKVRSGEYNTPKPFKLWLQGEHSLQQHDPMDVDVVDAEESTEPRP
jgi:hypothetical protein